MEFSNVHLDQFKDLLHLCALFIAEELVHYEEHFEERSQVDEEYICEDGRCALLKHSVPNELRDPAKYLYNEVEVELTHAKMINIFVL